MAYKTARQQRIHNKLYDQLQTFRFTKVVEKEQAAKALKEIIEKIDQVVEEELKGVKQ